MRVRLTDLKSGIATALFCLIANAAAQTPPSARIVVAQNVAHNLFQHTLPILLGAGPAQVSVVDIAFCGTQLDGGTKVLMVVQAGSPAKLAAPVLKMEFCSQPMSVVASALVPKLAQASALVSGTTQWNDWQLTVTAVAATAVHASPEDKALTLRVSAGTTLGKFSTRGMTTKLANGKAITLDGQFAFAGNRMYVALIETPATTALSAAYMTDGDLAAGENLDARLPLAFFNSLSQDQFGGNPFQLNSTGLPLRLMGASLKAYGDTLHSSGTLSLPAPLGDFDIDIAWKGQDLAVDHIDIVPHMTPCGPSDANCATMNSLKQQTASSYATTLSKQYKGTILRPTDWTRGIDLTFLGIPLHLSIQNNQASLVNGELKFINLVGVDIHEIH